MSTFKNTQPCSAAAILIAMSAVAQAAPLTVVDVGAPAVNCVYNTTCQIVVNDTIGSIAAPGISGTARLQSRELTGAAGAPGAGQHGYLYRIDLTQATGAGCVSALKLDFGPVTQLPYQTGGSPADVYVVTTGGLGNVAVLSADKTGNVITFVFSKPICAGPSPGKGDTSFFFGLTAAQAPKAITAQVQVAGGPYLNVPARVPIH